MREVIDEEMQPGAAVASESRADADIRARAGSVFHASCTCRMGPDPSEASSTTGCACTASSGLRVIDASIFPNVTSGNTNAPTMMVAEKGAAMVLEDSANR